MRLFAVGLTAFTITSASPLLDPRNPNGQPKEDRCNLIGYPCPFTGDTYCCREYLGYIVCPHAGQGYTYYECPSGTGCENPDGANSGRAFCQAL